MRERLDDRIIGVVLMIFSALYIFETTQFRRAMLSDPVGPRLFPVALGILLFLLSIYLLVKPDKNPVWPAPENWLRIGLVTLSFIAYAYLLVPLGFILTTTLEMIGLAVLFGGPPLRATIASLIFSFALYGLFDTLLGLSLPTGRIFAQLLGAG